MTRSILTFAEFVTEVESPAVPPATSWRPVFARLEPGELGPFASFCERHRLVVIDTIDRQLTELAAVRLPAGGKAERERWVADLVGATSREAYGCWVWLPWERKVVHALSAEDYFDVITDRNRDKLTRAELTLLRTKRIGVMGLSVGGEAAVTVAQEHLCGEIVLADFDRLDLSNLNRLNAGFDELGENKAVIVARRIARIDPYLKVTLFPDGVTEQNADAFLDGLDLLLEECDDLPLKYDVRLRARARAIDIVFAGDERGFLSIEPYASWPALQPFHGRIDRAPQPRGAYPSPLAFMQSLAQWLGGWDALSERSRSSLEQIGKTLCGYPQLASEARFAAGQVGHVVRRLLLGERVPPFIGHLDLEGLLPPGGGTAGG